MAWQPGEMLAVKGNVKKYMGFIQGAVRQGMKPTETYKLMREMGVSGRYVETLDAHRAITYAYKDPSAYLPTDNRLKPRADLVPYAHTRQKRAWSTTVGINVFNSQEGVLEVKHITIASKNLLTVEEYFTLAEEQIPNYPILESIQENETHIAHISYWEAPTLGGL